MLFCELRMRNGTINTYGTKTCKDRIPPGFTASHVCLWSESRPEEKRQAAARGGEGVGDLVSEVLSIIYPLSRTAAADWDLPRNGECRCGPKPGSLCHLRGAGVGSQA